MAEIGAEEGLLQAKELKIVSNLMRLHKLSVRDIMTPRPVMFSVPADMTVQDFFPAIPKRPFPGFRFMARPATTSRAMS